MSIKNSPHPYAMVTILFWSLAYVLTRLALQHFSPYALGFLRYAMASVALVAVVLLFKFKMPRLADLPMFLAAGATGFFVYMIAFNKGAVTVPASTSSVVVATVPVITALMARMAYREKLTVFQWGAIGISFAGVAVLTLMDSSLDLDIGVLWLLLASVSASVYNLLQRSLTRTYSGLQSSAFSIFTGTAMLGIFLPASIAEVQSALPVHLMLVVILGVFSSAVAYTCWSQALSLTKKTSTVSNYIFTMPFMTSLLGLLIAGEAPDMPTIVGGLIILTGVFLFNYGEKIHIHVTTRMLGRT